jgi:hypothetical protein
MFSKNRATLLVAGALLATSACGGNNTVPSSPGAMNAALQLSNPQAVGVEPADNTSILKRLKKDVTVGSTVDPLNGDTGPHALNIVRATYILKKGQLVVCNFADKAGAPGKGTTIDVLDPKPGSKPVRFAQNKNLLACTGDDVSIGNDVAGAGLGKHDVIEFTPHGKVIKSYGPPIESPFSDADASNPGLYAADYTFVSDARTGSIIDFSINNYGHPNEIAGVGGFAVNGAKGWGILGPSGLQYAKKPDSLYVVDGVDNTVVAISHASNLLVTNEIVVQPGGKTFKCKHPKTTCATLVYSGAPLDAPVAATLLPNGNLIVANTHGGNKLVELTPAGTVLAVKAVDKSATPHVFGLASAGTSDTNTVVYYTTTENNTVHVLEP